MAVPKKKNLLTLLFLISLCAVLAVFFKYQQRRASYNPNQLVVETRYSEPWTDRIGIRQADDRILLFKEFGKWDSGADWDQVVKALGKPQYQLEFMGDEYFVWNRDARFDWDLEDRYSGDYLMLKFYYSDRLFSATIHQELPESATPYTEESEQEE